MYFFCLMILPSFIFYDGRVFEEIPDTNSRHHDELKGSYLLRSLFNSRFWTTFQQSPHLLLVEFQVASAFCIRPDSRFYRPSCLVAIRGERKPRLETSRRQKDENKSRYLRNVFKLSLRYAFRECYSVIHCWIVRKDECESKDERSEPMVIELGEKKLRQRPPTCLKHLVIRERERESAL